MFFKSFPLFTILGFKVRLDVSWLLLATLVVVMRAQVFTAPPFELEAPSAVSLGIVFALGLLMSIVLHELAHSLVARRFGIQIRGITLFILGGVSEMEEEPATPWSEFLIAIVGPITSLLIAVPCWLIATTGQDVLPEALVALAFELMLLNLVVAVFNMLPAFPLDGGRVLRSILWALKGDVIWASRVAGVSGQGFGLLMIVGGVALVFSGRVGMIMFVLIGWFIYRAAPMPHRMLVMRKKLSAATIAPFVDVEPRVVPADLSVADLLETAVSGDEALPVISEGRIVAMVELRAAEKVPEDQRPWRHVMDIATKLSAKAVVSAGTSAEEALRRMQELQLPALLVVDATRLIGIVRWRDLLKFAELKP